MLVFDFAYGGFERAGRAPVECLSRFHFRCSLGFGLGGIRLPFMGQL